MSTDKIAQLNKEIEERQLAIAEEQKRLEEAQREARRIEEEKKEQEREKARRVQQQLHRNKFLGDAKKIVAALKAQGFAKAKVEDREGADFPVILPQGEGGVGPIVFFDYMMDRSERWHARSSGVKVQVGQTYVEGNKRFPQRKGGDFNYDGIAQAYKDLWDTEVARTNRRNHEKVASQSNEARVKRLTSKFGVKPYEKADYKSIPNVGIYHYTSHGTGKDFRTVERNDNDLVLKVEHISEENADKLLQFMKDNGMFDKE